MKNLTRRHSVRETPIIAANKPFLFFVKKEICAIKLQKQSAWVITYLKGTTQFPCYNWDLEVRCRYLFFVDEKITSFKADHIFCILSIYWKRDETKPRCLLSIITRSLSLFEHFSQIFYSYINHYSFLYIEVFSNCFTSCPFQTKFGLH